MTKTESSTYKVNRSEARKLILRERLGRSSILDKKGGFSNILKPRSLVSYPVEIINFLVAEEFEHGVLSYIAKKYDLRSPGKRTIYSHEVEVLKQCPQFCVNSDIHFQTKTQEYFFEQLVGMICVVQRGEGDKIARIPLNVSQSGHHLGDHIGGAALVGGHHPALCLRFQRFTPAGLYPLWHRDRNLELHCPRQYPLLPAPETKKDETLKASSL